MGLSAGGRAAEWLRISGWTALGAGFWLGERLGEDVIETGFDHFQPTEVSLEVHKGLVEQEKMGEVGAGIEFVAVGSDLMEFAVEVGSLGVDDFEGVDMGEIESEHQFEKDLVATVVGGDRGEEPVLESFLTNGGDSVRGFDGATILTAVNRRDELFFFELIQGAIDLSRFEVPILGAAHDGVERLVEFIAVTRLLGEEGEDRILEKRHRATFVRVAIN